MMTLSTRDLGEQQDFQKTWKLQESLVQDRRKQKIPDTLLLLEHSPVYTIGRTRDQSSLRDTSHLPHPVVEINRGGQGTYHGPGQLVGYAILDLNHYQRDLHQHLRNLEEAIIRTLRNYDIEAIRHDGLTGVWVEDRKIASLGVGVRQWTSLHGLALNAQKICLRGFQHITPCGLDGVSITCIESETDHPVIMDQLKSRLSRHLGEILENEWQP
ncbi:lipoyl(octanoyl) transferase LipB [Akkermansiaceae bacterium]|nr:lipoyl(octanoyl) transferase LipB [Akkermansiaceae bacterium]